MCNSNSNGKEHSTDNYDFTEFMNKNLLLSSNKDMKFLPRNEPTTTVDGLTHTLIHTAL